MTRRRPGDRSGHDPDIAGLPPVFLEQHSYRRRRLTDAARLLPLLGAALFAVPLLWPVAPDGDPARQMPTSAALFYIFAVWAGLIVVNAVFAWLSRRSGEGGQDPGEG